MLQYITDLPDDVVGIHAIGEVTKDDMDKVLLPHLDNLAKEQGSIKYLLVLDTNVSDCLLGAWWADIITGLKHLTKWGRVAIVTDEEGVEWFTTNVFKFFIPGTSKGFALSEIEAAKQWVAQ